MKVKCDVCGAKATRRIRRPQLIHLCRRCWKRIRRELSGFPNALASIVPKPPGCSNAETKGIHIASEMKREGAIGVITWMARNVTEYNRAEALGLIGGWVSFEHYEASLKETLSQMPNVEVLEASPDDIVAGLERYGLPNTHIGRAQLYPLLLGLVEQT